MFNPFAARCVHKLVPVHPSKPMRVIEFGNQRYGAKGVVPGTDGVASTEQFYKRLGFTTYVALDVNTDMGAQIVDLNEAMSAYPGYDLMLGRFDLVTNNGTGEHIFDQANVFKNAHDLCMPGGVMLHVLPFSPWINHGFYTVQPILFRDLAAVNGYEILFIAINHRDGDLGELPSAAWPYVFTEKNPKWLLDHMNLLRKNAPTPDLLIGVALRKQLNAPFRKPLQGKYKSAMQDDGLRLRYQP